MKPMLPSYERALSIRQSLAKWGFLEFPAPEIIDPDMWEDMRKLTDHLEDALIALAVMADWPRVSDMASGLPSSDPAVGLANVRRFAREALGRAGTNAR